MRVSSLLLATLCVACLCAGVTAATQGVLGTAQATGTTYGYGALGVVPFVTVTTTSSATATVNLVVSATADTLSSFGASGLPAGVTLTSDTFLSAAVGLQVDVSANASAVSAIQITFPSLSAASQANFAAGVLGVLFFSADSQTYVRIPASALSIDGSGQLMVNWNQEGYFWIVNFSSAPVQKSIANGVAAVAVAANTTVNIYITESASANARVALAVQNLTSAAGAVAISTSNQASAEAQTAQQNGRVVLSQIYNITYSGANQGVSATLTFNAQTSTAASGSFNAATASWYRLVHGTSVWVKQASTINADASVSVQVSGFSDWSVQADSTSSSSTGGSGGDTGAAAGLAPLALLAPALAALLLA